MPFLDLGLKNRICQPPTGSSRRENDARAARKGSRRVVLLNGYQGVRQRGTDFSVRLLKLVQARLSW